MVTSLIPILIGRAAPEDAGGQSGRRGSGTFFSSLIELDAGCPSVPDPASEAGYGALPIAVPLFPWPSPMNPEPGRPAVEVMAAADPDGVEAAAMPRAMPPIPLSRAVLSSVPRDAAGAPLDAAATTPAEAASPYAPALRQSLLRAPAAPVAAAITPAQAASAAEEPLPVPPLQATDERPLVDTRAAAGPASPSWLMVEGRAAKRAPPAALDAVRPVSATNRRLPASIEESRPPVWPADPVSGPRPAPADAAAPARPAQAPEPRAATAAVQIAASIARGMHGAPPRLVVELVPRELGRVEITLDVEKRGGRARITAERRDTLDLLMTEARMLEKALNDAGVDLGRRGIEFALRGDGGRDREPPSPQTPPGRAEEAGAGSRPEAASPPEPGLPLSRSGLDILV